MPIKLLARFGYSTYDRVDHYPDLAPLRNALRAEDWPAVVAFLDRLPDGQDPTVAAAMVAEMPGVENHLRRAGARQFRGVRRRLRPWEPAR